VPDFLPKAPLVSSSLGLTLLLAYKEIAKDPFTSLSDSLPIKEFFRLLLLLALSNFCYSIFQ